MQLGFSHYSSISNFDEERSIEELVDKILVIANRLAADRSDDGGTGDGRWRIYHAQLVEEVLSSNLGPKLSSVKAHEALRYLIENRFLFEVENAALICYTRRQPLRHSVYEISEEEYKKMTQQSIIVSGQKSGFFIGDLSSSGNRNRRPPRHRRRSRGHSGSSSLQKTEVQTE
jgi:hypothetical protein